MKIDVEKYGGTWRIPSLCFCILHSSCEFSSSFRNASNSLQNGAISPSVDKPATTISKRFQEMNWGEASKPCHSLIGLQADLKLHSIISKVSLTGFNLISKKLCCSSLRRKFSYRCFLLWLAWQFMCGSIVINSNTSKIPNQKRRIRRGSLANLDNGSRFGISVSIHQACQVLNFSSWCLLKNLFSS